MAELLTTNLHLELEKTNQAFSRWAEKQVDWLESTGNNFTKQMEECEFTIVALKENELQLENARELNDVIKTRQKVEMDDFLSQIERFKQQKKNHEAQLRRLEEEEQKESNRLEAARAEIDVLRMRMEQTLNDLTIGVKLYAALGLEFTKADGDCMKFIFSNVDPGDPNKQFYFTMYVDENDSYRLVDAVPAISPTFAKKHMEILNSDNDIGKFVVNVRRYFRRTVA
jgi:hypothetical protein